jgi:hypothetical protein
MTIGMVPNLCGRYGIGNANLKGENEDESTEQLRGILKGKGTWKWTNGRYLNHFQ